MEDTVKIKTDPLVQRLIKERDVALEFQQRKHDHWNENYTLYRDFVPTNRLTQRQPVNFPIMKETGKTWLSKIDEQPTILFESLDKSDKGKQKELVVNEVWDDDYKRMKLDILDILEKKIVYLQARTIKKLNFIDGQMETDILDPYDFLVDPKAPPLYLELARYAVHTHIFRTLRDIIADNKYDDKAKNKLKEYLDSDDAVVKIEKAVDAKREKDDRLGVLGVKNFDDFGAGDVIVELNEFYTNLWDETTKKFIRYLITVAVDNIILLKKPLKEVIGVEFYPFVSWADDLDLNDFWSDGPGDQVRTPNKILNIWLSQWLENRTLRNYGMVFYDSNKINALSFDPKPFGQYGIPVPDGKTLDQVLKNVEIPNLGNTVNDLEYIVRMIEKATGVTSTEKGVSEKKQITLGEVQINLGESAERRQGISKMYNPAWIEYAQKWYEMKKANTPSTLKTKLHKKGRSSEAGMFELEVRPSDWISEKGYRILAMSSSEQEADKVTAFQKMMAIAREFPTNKVLQKIAKRRMLEIGNLTSDEMKEVMDEEEKGIEVPDIPAGPPTGAPTGAPIALPPGPRVPLPA
ncbi:hypothetical protein MYX07_00330 [Patescibacteria group bacterium AH-259-L07]|nr:hypothetical protein [Patescibacteria group bacterium AH-259-L07]